MTIQDIETPALLVDRDALERNIARMRDIAASAGVAYRPHAKTHKSPVVARMQMEAGAVGICCAKLGEAEVMAEAGLPDILVTSEMTGRNRMARLIAAARQARLSVVVDHERHVAELAEAASTAGLTLDVYIEVDIGQGRCGVRPGDAAATLAARIGGHASLRFRGLQGYQGSLQMLPSFAERAAEVEKAMALLKRTADAVRGAGIAVDVLTGGGSGSSVIDTGQGVYTELQPGSYVFMDSRYRAIEWPARKPQPFECALTVLGTVVSRPDDKRAIIDVGYKCVSMDSGPPVPADFPDAAFAFKGDEHGELSFAGRSCPLAIGDKAVLVPSHCDTTVNLYDRYVVTRGETVDAVWDIPARGRSQ